MKLGAYMPSTCHWMPSVASVTEWPQPTMASGAEVITMFMIDIAGDAAGDRDDEPRLPRDLRQRAAGILRALRARHAAAAISSCVSTRPASAASIDCAMKVAANRYGGHQSLVTITTAAR